MPHPAPQPLKQSLLRAIDLENDHIHRFRTWALRLRPFDLSLARILDLQAEEMRDHKGMLLDCSTTQTSRSRILPIITAHQAPTTEHFFIINPAGAATILEKARALKEEARRFYLQCVQTESENSQLIRVYQGLQNFKDSHVKILLEAQAGFASKHYRIPNLALQSLPLAILNS